MIYQCLNLDCQNIKMATTITVSQNATDSTQKIVMNAATNQPLEPLYQLLPSTVLTGMAVYSLFGCFIILMKRLLRSSSNSVNLLLPVSIFAWLFLVTTTILQLVMLWIQQYTIEFIVTNKIQMYTLTCIKIAIENMAGMLVFLAMYLRISGWKNPSQILSMLFLKRTIQFLLAYLIANCLFTMYAGTILNDPRRSIAEKTSFRRVSLPLSMIRLFVQTAYSCVCTAYFLFIIARGIGKTLRYVLSEILFHHGGPTLFVSVLLHVVVALWSFDSIPGLGSQQQISKINLYVSVLLYSLELHSFLSVSFEVTKELIKQPMVGNQAPVLPPKPLSHNLRTSSLMRPVVRPGTKKLSDDGSSDTFGCKSKFLDSGISMSPSPLSDMSVHVSMTTSSQPPETLPTPILYPDDVTLPTDAITSPLSSHPPRPSFFNFLVTNPDTPTSSPLQSHESLSPDNSRFGSHHHGFFPMPVLSFNDIEDDLVSHSETASRCSWMPDASFPFSSRGMTRPQLGESI